MGKATVSENRILIDEILKNSLAKAGNSKSALSRALDLRVATVCMWYRGIRPSEKNIMKLEGFLKKKYSK